MSEQTSLAREVSVAEAIRCAQGDLLRRDPSVVVMGLNAMSPLGIFGTVSGLYEEFGSDRVIETPASEAAMTGIALGMATAGHRPIVVHQRFDFALLTVDQTVNQVAKWHYMYGGRLRAPMVVRMVVGRGWGQGPQHSQALHAWFAHVPGLRVVMSSFPQESYDQLYLATMSDTPVIFVEHRWMHLVKGPLIQKPPGGSQRTTVVRKAGLDVTIVATSYMVVESILAAEMLTTRGISAEVLDLIVVSPLETEVIEASVKKTGRLLVADIGGKSFGIGSEIVSTISEKMLRDLRAAPCRIGLPFVPTPTSAVAAADFYPRAVDIANQVLFMLGHRSEDFFTDSSKPNQLDVPNPQFFGPY